jgi:hypothetical protein
MNIGDKNNSVFFDTFMPGDDMGRYIKFLQ